MKLGFLLLLFCKKTKFSSFDICLTLWQKELEVFGLTVLLLQVTDVAEMDKNCNQQTTKLATADLNHLWNS